MLPVVRAHALWVLRQQAIDLVPLILQLAEAAYTLEKVFLVRVHKVPPR